MKKITIIDYGCGNILNLIRAIKFLGYDAEATHEHKKIINSSHVILPGVGAFGAATAKLEKYNLKNTILEYAKQNNPLLGICLGMQLLFSESHEFGIHKGLGLIAGEVNKISNRKNKSLKIPHVGWNEIYFNDKNKILKNRLEKKDFYFVHSYVCNAKKIDSTIAVCKYSEITIPAVVASNNILGCQFHPEKSAENGLIFLKHFCDL